MPIFPDAKEAYRWAYWDILKPWREGRAYDPNPEMFRGGTATMGAVLVALTIESFVRRSCKRHQPCRYFSKTCLLDVWWPDPKQYVPNRSESEWSYINACIAKYEEMLRQVKYIA